MFAILIFLAILSVLVLVHEFGHYFAARIFGVKAEEFGYGFPPRAIGFVKDHGKWKCVKGNDQKIYASTIWSLNWLPLGGFVRLKGEQGEHAYDADSFLSKAGYKKFIILAAGVMMNWILAAAIFSVAFTVGVPIQTDQLPQGAIVTDQRIQITDIAPNSAAAKAGMMPGDFLVSIDGKSVVHVTEAQASLKADAEAGRSIAVQFFHQDIIKSASVKAEYVEALKRPGLGIALSDTGVVRFPWHKAVIQGITSTWMYTKIIVVGLYSLLHDLIIQHKVTADVSGPVGIAVITGEIAKQGWWSLAQFTALLSLNLAVVNFLPIPALDGGRAIFVFVETLRRRRTNPKFEALIHQIGFIALISLIAIVTFHDLRQYGGVIVNGLKGIVGL